MKLHVLGLLLLLLAGCHEAASASAEPSASSRGAQPAAVSGECGHSGVPDCPLQNWMKSTLQTYQRAADYDRLGRSLSELAEHAPKNYAGWQDLAKRGARAAAAKDDAAVRQVCKDCHAQHRARYRRELRAQTVL